MEQPEQFEQWCLVELMGRQRIAGLVSERVIAGQGFLEVAVPETKHNPKFTRFVSPGSVYALNPLDEQTARAYAESLRVKPIDAWDINEFLKKAEEQRLLSSPPAVEDNWKSKNYQEEAEDYDR